MIGRCICRLTHSSNADWNRTLTYGTLERLTFSDKLGQLPQSDQALQIYSTSCSAEKWSFSQTGSEFCAQRSSIWYLYIYIHFMYLYVSLCIFMYLYVSLCIFMYLYVSLCIFTSVSSCALWHSCSIMWGWTWLMPSVTTTQRLLKFTHTGVQEPWQAIETYSCIPMPCISWVVLFPSASRTATKRFGSAYQGCNHRPVNKGLRLDYFLCSRRLFNKESEDWFNSTFSSVSVETPMSFGHTTVGTVTIAHETDPGGIY